MERSKDEENEARCVIQEMQRDLKCAQTKSCEAKQKLCSAFGSTPIFRQRTRTPENNHDETLACHAQRDKKNLNLDKDLRGKFSPKCTAGVKKSTQDVDENQQAPQPHYTLGSNRLGFLENLSSVRSRREERVISRSEDQKVLLSQCVEQSGAHKLKQ